MTDPIAGEARRRPRGLRTGGRALANRLSGGPPERLLLDGGGRDGRIRFLLPVGRLCAIGDPRADRPFGTAAETGRKGRARLSARRGTGRRKVAGPTGRRVPDRSAMPANPSGDTGSPTVTIAEEGAPGCVRTPGPGAPCLSTGSSS